MPPKALTRAFTPSTELVFSFAASILMTLWNALPSHIMAALGASSAMCSTGHNPARNSSFREYSWMSVSPGWKTGIWLQGKCDSPPEDVPDEVEVGPPVCSPVPSIVNPWIYSFQTPKIVVASWLHTAPLPMCVLHTGSPWSSSNWILWPTWAPAEARPRALFCPMAAMRPSAVKGAPSHLSPQLCAKRLEEWICHGHSMTPHALKDNGTQGEWNGKQQAEITIYIYIQLYYRF